jgi:pimeloyl-ACP methyl ester carboxylesterase
MTMSILLAAVTAAFQPAPCVVKSSLDKPPVELAGVECGWVDVLRDAARPDGKSIRLWIARIKATGPRKSDPILYINGGPGIATVDAILPELDSVKALTAMRASRDIILFDQRGSGRSEESLCPRLLKQLNAVSEQGLSPAVEADRGRALFVGCRQELAAKDIDVNAYTTDATVRDMEAIRQALGVEQWNLLSVSYGSIVALHAMRTYPATLRSVILNSPYPPNSVSWAEQASIAAAAYSAVDRACGKQPKCRAHFGALVPKLEATLARLEANPLRDGDRKITGRLFAQALWPLAVQSSTVRFVPLAIHRAHAGDAATIKGLVRTFAGGETWGDYSPAQTFAIMCHESGRTRDWYARARRLYPALVPDAPDDSMDRTCAAFRPGFVAPEFFAPVASDIPTLLYAGSLDAATPVVDAYQAMRFLSHATLVEVDGASHAPLGRDECTRGIAVDFLDRPEVAPDLSCISARPPIDFAQDGLAKLFAPMKP